MPPKKKPRGKPKKTASDDLDAFDSDDNKLVATILARDPDITADQLNQYFPYKKFRQCQAKLQYIRQPNFGIASYNLLAL